LLTIINSNISSFLIDFSSGCVCCFTIIIWPHFCRTINDIASGGSTGDAAPMDNEKLGKESTQVDLVDCLIRRRERAGDRFDIHRSGSIEELLGAIEAEKAGTLDSFARDIWALERRVASLEEDRNRRDALDATAAAVRD
jgi:hypothetical protein